MMILLTQGLAGSAVYLMLGLGLVLIFSVTRVIFVPLGSIAVFAALSLAAMENGQTPPAINLVVLLVVLALVLEVVHLWRVQALKRLPRSLLSWGVIPLLPCAYTVWAMGQDAQGLRIIAAVVLVIPLGPLIERVVFRPIARSSVLRLLIVALIVEFVVEGFALLWFGPNGIRTKASLDGSVAITANWIVDYQAMLIIVVAIVLSLLFYGGLQKTKLGKVLHATASNPTGARLVGIRPGFTATMAHSVAGTLAGIVGILISSTITIYYNSGLMLTLKAFVAAILAGLESYLLTIVGALVVGVPEVFAAFWNSAWQNVIVFGLLIPILAIRAAFSSHGDEDDEEEDA